MKSTLFLIAIAAGLFSCTSYESARNTHSAREYLTEDLEEQIVYNLILASNGQPFAHYDVSNAQSLVAVKATPSVSVTRIGLSTGFAPGVVVTSAVRNITRTITGGSGSERSNQVNITIQPIYNDPKVYAAYVDFLNLPAKKKSDRVFPPKPEETGENPRAAKLLPEGEDLTPRSPGPGNPKPSPEPFPKIIGRFHSIVGQDEKPTSKDLYVPGTLRRYEGRWYYVPIRYKLEFSDLCMAVVARGKPAADSATAKAVEKNTQQLQQLQLRDF